MSRPVPPPPRRTPPPLPRCEFCHSAPVLQILTDHPSWAVMTGRDAESYTVCPNCLIFLVAYSLSPEQVLRAGGLHRHLLHDDFYCPETGEAFQPRLEVVAYELTLPTTDKDTPDA